MGGPHSSLVLRVRATPQRGAGAGAVELESREGWTRGIESAGGQALPTETVCRRSVSRLTPRVLASPTPSRRWEPCPCY